MRRGFTLVELLVVIAIVGALISFLMPAVMAARDAALRAQCQSNQRQLGLACQSFHAVHDRLPVGKEAHDPKTTRFPAGTWLVHLLPHVEQKAVYDRAVADWAGHDDATSNQHAGFSTPIAVYGCPADSRTDEAHETHYGFRPALTSYPGVMGRNWSTADGTLIAGRGLRLADVLDGTSQTLMIGERPPSPDFWFGWWYSGMGQHGTGSADMLLGIQEINTRTTSYTNHCPTGPYPYRDGHPQEMCDTYHFWSLHAGGANFARADGSVGLLPYETDPAVLAALATRAGGEAGAK